MSRVFHLLTESDPFSRHSRRPLSRWVANVLEQDQNAIVLAPSTDSTWSLDQARVRVVKGLAAYKAFQERGGHLLPQRLSSSLLKRVLEASLQDLKAGDTVWIHDRPEFALTLAPMIRLRGARLFLHIHTAHLVQASLLSLQAFQPDCYVFSSPALELEALAHFPSMAPTEVLSSGLDYRAFYPPVLGEAHASLETGHEATVVFSAHLAREHDLQVFLDAMEILRIRRVPVRGSIVGGPETSLAKMKPREANPARRESQNVFYESYSTAAALGKKLRASELFCVPSGWDDSASLHMLEALACGLPVVTTQSNDRGGGHKAVPGILVVANAAERLAAVIQSLVEDGAARNQFAQEAYGTYTGSLMWSLTRDAYHSVLASQLPAEQPLQPLSLSLPNSVQTGRSACSASRSS